jgi:hypothetical protein
MHLCNSTMCPKFGAGRSRHACPAISRRQRYDRGCGEAWREITTFSGVPPIRLQRFPEQ